MEYKIMGNSHLWGDENFDWKSLDEASNYIWKRCRRYGRFGVWTKEKYGTLRISTTCAYWGEWPIHNIFKPGHVCYRWPRWIMLYVEYPLGTFFRAIGVTSLVVKYQTAVLKYFWKRAAKKWPQVSKEILDEYNWMTSNGKY